MPLIWPNLDYKIISNNLLIFFRTTICSSWKDSKLYCCVIFKIFSSSLLVWSVVRNDIISPCSVVAVSCFIVADSEKIPLLTHSVSIALTWSMKYHKVALLYYMKRNTLTHTCTQTKEDTQTETLAQLLREGNYDETIIWYKTEGKMEYAWKMNWCSIKQEKGLFLCHLSSSARSLLISLYSWTELHRALSHSSPMTSLVDHVVLSANSQKNVKMNMKKKMKTFSMT